MTTYVVSCRVATLPTYYIHRYLHITISMIVNYQHPCQAVEDSILYLITVARRIEPCTGSARIIRGDDHLSTLNSQSGKADSTGNYSCDPDIYRYLPISYYILITELSVCSAYLASLVFHYRGDGSDQSIHSCRTRGCRAHDS